VTKRNNSALLEELKTDLIAGLPVISGRRPLKIELCHESLLPEAYCISCLRGCVTISGTDYSALAYGLCHLKMALLSGHIGDVLGLNAPRFPLRPLWLGGQCRVQLSSSIMLSLPKLLLQSIAADGGAWLCRRMLQGGFNALVLGSQDSYLFPSSNAESISLGDVDIKGLDKLFKKLQESGIKLIFKPEFSFSPPSEAWLKSPFDSTFGRMVDESFQEFFSFIPTEASILWESMLFGSNYRSHPQAELATELETVIAEVHLIERCLQRKRPLIFFIPASRGRTTERHAEWFSQLVDEMGEHTSLAFPAVWGDICDDHASDHPFWKILRRSRDVSATPLIPIVNLGLVRQGEGLWPTCNVDLLERFLPRCKTHNFAGVITTWHSLPASGSLHDCNYWVSGKALWSTLSPALLAETWFTVHRPTEEVHLTWSAMKNARLIALGLAHLKHQAAERGRALWQCQQSLALAESLIAQLRYLKAEISAFPKVSSPAPLPLAGMFPFFIADVARLLHYLMPTLSVSSFQALDLHHEGFWSLNKDSKHPSQDACFPLEPLCGSPGSIMESIYLANRP
jgi:hypothetical protein